MKSEQLRKKDTTIFVVTNNKNRAKYFMNLLKSDFEKIRFDYCELDLYKHSGNNKSIVIMYADNNSSAIGETIKSIRSFSDDPLIIANPVNRYYKSLYSILFKDVHFLNTDKFQVSFKNILNKIF